MPPPTLFRYIFRRMAISVVILYAALSSLIFIVEFIESLRFADKVEGAGFGFALTLTALRAPGLGLAMVPFVFLFGALWMFAKLNRRSELSVMRSAGLSIWRAIGPAALLAALAGVLIIVVVDPLSARMMGEAERAKDGMRGQTSTLVQQFGDGLWLRYRDAESTILMNASAFDEAASLLTNVTVWRIDADLKFVERVDAPRAYVSGRTIELRDAQMRTPLSSLSQKTPFYMIPTNLTASDFRDGAAPPETIAVWELPRFVAMAKAAGLPTVRYDLRFHDLCSTPLKLVAMVLIAAMFSLRPTRQGGALGLVLVAIGTGFLLYVLVELSSAMAESGTAPVALAAWTPALVACVIAATGLLNLEDG